MYSKAGLIDDEFESPSVSEAIDADAVLSSEEKKVLLDLYRNLVRARGLTTEDTLTQE
jgi:hypothetical protein